MNFKIENANFQPWVGKNYEKGINGNKILVLGESHYCLNERSAGGRCEKGCSKCNMNEQCHNMTNEVLTDFKDNFSWFGTKYLRCFYIFSRLIIGRALSVDESKRFWDNVIFYNYLQYSQVAPQQPINQNYWSPSEEAFKELILKCRPNLVLVWGKRLYYGMPQFDGCSEEKISIDGEELFLRKYKIKDFQFLCLMCYHPSSCRGRSWKKWHPFYIQATKQLDK